MKSLPETDLALIKTVQAHLRQLASVSLHNADEASLTVVSGSLRALLVEDLLIRASKAAALPGPMTFRSWCIVSTEGDDVVAYCGGGDILPGIPFSACRNAKLEERTLDLKAFCTRPRIQVGAVKVSTAELIQYVANTLGGAHFDPEGKSPKSRKPAFDLLRKLQTGEISGPPFKVNERHLLHHELLSITQAVIRSPEVGRLMAFALK